MNYYSQDPTEEAEIRRWAFLSGYSMRNDLEEAEALRLQAKYGEAMGWPLVPRESYSVNPTTPFAKSIVTWKD